MRVMRVAAALLATIVLAGCGTIADAFYRGLKIGSYRAAHPRACVKLLQHRVTMNVFIKPPDEALVDCSIYLKRPPMRGDLIAFHPPKTTKNARMLFIQRIIAIPGDSFHTERGWAFINGRSAGLDYAIERPRYDLAVRNRSLYLRRFATWIPLLPQFALIPPASQWKVPDRIPQGYYLVLEDHRNGAEDSHAFGFVPRRAIFGKVVYDF